MIRELKLNLYDNIDIRQEIDDQFADITIAARFWYQLWSSWRL